MWIYFFIRRISPMLKQLRIKNIILIESAEIDFAEGFNVLSGETGSGKSAIMNAIRLTAGERAETGIIRKGADKGVVEAVFDIKGLVEVENLLELSGIDREEGAELYIRREIFATGKSRAFINHQLAQLSLLRALSTHLIHLVGQHANQDLLSLDRHRELLDLFGNIKEEVAAFSTSWEEENALQNELEQLINNEAQRLREMEVCHRVLEELEEAHLKVGEEEELFSEYTLLTHAEELGTKVQEVCQVLDGEKAALLPHLNRQQHVVGYLASLDPALKDLSEAFHNAVLELQEVASALTLYQSRLEYNPVRTSEINERLKLITRLKKKYGPTVEDMQSFAEESKKKLQVLENADNRIEELKDKLELVKTKNNQRASQLSDSRRKAAVRLAAALKKELCSLNMPKVDFQIDIHPSKRNRYGDDKIEFFLLPNLGERRISIKDCASGGELSRVMLSLQTVLSDKQRIPTLIFDEVDSNIGGATAAIVGEKLKAIGKDLQVLCITHFPQVAQHADYHLQISKKVVGDRTVTFVNLLDASTRKQELARMTGKAT
jgi:DNA repair protein RecN (Recombination protein N)